MAILGQCEHRVFAQARSVGCRVVVIPASIGSTRWTSSRPAPFSACVRSVLSSLRRASGDRRSSSYAPSANLSRSTLGGYRPTTTSVPHRRLASPVLRRRTPLWRPWAGERSPPAVAGWPPGSRRCWWLRLGRQRPSRWRGLSATGCGSCGGTK